MIGAGPLSVVTLPDHQVAGTPLRPALWHATALMVSGYQISPSEYKHDVSSMTWRTWHISNRPVIVQPDPLLGGGSQQLMGMFDDGRMVREQPKCPYLAAYYAARNLDILVCYLRWGGEPPLTVAIGPRSPVAALVPRGLNQVPLRAVASERLFTTSDIHLAAALITMGFPLDIATESGVRVFAIERADETRASLLDPELTLPLCEQASRIVREKTDAVEQQVIADPTETSYNSPLPDAHLFHWAVVGAIRREWLRDLEKQLGDDSSKIRRHVLQGKSRTPGHAVVATREEFNLNEAAIVAHLRKT